jgi:hypothetical protein
MAGSLIGGCGGGVTLPDGFVAKMKSWEATIDVKDVDTTGFPDGAYSNCEAVGYSLSGSAVGFLTQGTGSDPTVPDGGPPIPTAAFPTDLTDCSGLASFSGAMTLTAITGCTYTGTFLITKVKIGREAHNIGTVSYDFKNQGKWQEAWA